MNTTKPSNAMLQRAIRTALSGSTLVAAFGSAHAQQAPVSVGGDTTLSEVVVTGSRIAVPNDSAISPVIAVSSEDIAKTGVTRVEDLLNELPQVFASQGSTISNGSDGTATVDLRGLGAKRTLVLVNGFRLGPGDPTSGGASDLNMIPVELIDSVEVLTGGASSTYGADAVAGVVNFKLNDHFEGVKLVADAGFYNHSNSDVQGVDEAISAKGFQQAPSSVNPGNQKSLAFIAGVNSPDNKGNATFYATYREVAAVMQGDYSYSACTLGSGYLAGSYSTGGKFTCGGSSTSYPGRFNLVNANGSLGPKQTIGPNGTLVPFTGSDLYNYGPLNYFQRPDERYTAGAFLHYEFNEHADVYSQSMFMDDRSVAQIAPGGAFFGSATYNVPCSNPFLSSSELSTWCGGATNGNFNLLIGRRNVEGGPRQSALEHVDFHEVLGVKGKIDDAWTYDASFQYSSVNLTSDTTGYFNSNNLQNALDVTGTASNPQCASGPPCVPYNIFQLGGVTPAAVNYLSALGSASGKTEQRIVNVNFTGDLGKYGIQSPLASSGLKVNVGGEYRDETLSFLPDYAEQNANQFLSGFGGNVLPVSGGLIAKEGFLESRMPIAEDRFMAKSLDVEAGYRYSSYDQGFQTNTFKFGVDWAPTSDFRLRGSFQRAVRAPNIVELYAASSVALDGTFTADPCAGPATNGLVNGYNAAQCGRTGVTAAQFGNVQVNPAGQYNGLLGGNTGLQPETALTTSFGIGFTPSFIPNFRAQIDYFNIVVENVIQNVGGGNILSQCLNNGVLCNDIHRDSFGSLWIQESGYVTDTLQNVGKLQERGIDLDMSYTYDLGRFGKLHSSIVGTYVDNFITTPIAASPSTAYDCGGYYGSICGTPTFRWRHKLNATWSTPWSGLDLSATWRYYSPVTLEQLSPNANLAAAGGGTVANGGISNTDAFLSSRSYLDLEASVRLVDHVTVRLGVNNVLDKAPPVIGTSNLPGVYGNGNTFPQVYDALGRFIFGQIIAQF